MSLNIEVVIPAALVSAVITVIGNLIATLMARKTARVTARETANQEIRKTEHLWKREDVLASDEEYSEMVKLVVLYASGTTMGPYEALASIAALRVKETGDMAGVLDSLYRSVKQRKLAEVDQVLDILILARRSSKQKS